MKIEKKKKKTRATLMWLSKEIREIDHISFAEKKPMNSRKIREIGWKIVKNLVKSQKNCSLKNHGKIMKLQTER